MGKLFKTIANIYDHAGLETVRRAQTVAIVSIILIVFVAALLFVQLFDQQESIIARVSIASVTILILVASVFLLLKGYFKFCSHFLLLTSYFSLFTLSLSLNYEVARELYFFPFTVLFGIVLSCLIGYHKSQPILYGVLGLAGLAIIYILKIKPILVGHQFDKAILVLSTSSIFIVSSSIAAYFALSLMKDLVKYSDRQAETIQKRYEKIQELIQSARKGLEIGEVLKETVGDAIDRSKTVFDGLNTIRAEIISLNQASENSRSVNKKVVESAKLINELTLSNSTVVSEASASIEEMTSSINSIVDIIKVKRCK
jgi:hypothetical protein